MPRAQDLAEGEWPALVGESSLAAQLQTQYRAIARRGCPPQFGA